MYFIQFYGKKSAENLSAGSGKLTIVLIKKGTHVKKSVIQCILMTEILVVAMRRPKDCAKKQITFIQSLIDENLQISNFVLSTLLYIYVVVGNI